MVDGRTLNEKDTIIWWCVGLCAASGICLNAVWGQSSNFPIAPSVHDNNLLGASKTTSVLNFIKSEIGNYKQLCATSVREKRKCWIVLQWKSRPMKTITTTCCRRVGKLSDASIAFSLAVIFVITLRKKTWILHTNLWKTKKKLKRERERFTGTEQNQSTGRSAFPAVSTVKLMRNTK